MGEEGRPKVLNEIEAEARGEEFSSAESWQERLRELAGGATEVKW